MLGIVLDNGKVDASHIVFMSKLEKKHHFLKIPLFPAFRKL